VLQVAVTRLRRDGTRDREEAADALLPDGDHAIGDDDDGGRRVTD
jgi:hypothetical protein